MNLHAQAVAVCAAQCCLVSSHSLPATRQLQLRWHQGSLRLPRDYTWQAKERRWKRRVLDAPNEDIGMPRMIGRVYSIHPSQIELYALRLLLNHVRGARSCKELRTFTINGKTTTHNSFQAAAVARDLVNNDNMWIECMKEADETKN